MKKRARVIQVSGLRGILMMAFIGTCLAAGFIAFPAICAMKLWNYAANFAPLPLINIFQGLMLWTIVAISGFIINDKKKFIVEFQAPIQQLSEKDMEKLMERVKFQSQAKVLNSMLLKSSELKPIEKITPVEKTECKKENKKEEDKKEIEKENV